MTVFPFIRITLLLNLFVNQFFHFPSNFEVREFLRRDMDNLASFGVSTLISTVMPDHKGSKSSDLNSVALLQTFSHCIKKSIYDGMEMARNA